MKTKWLLFLFSLLVFTQHSLAACKRGGGVFADKSMATSTVALPANVVVESRSYAAGESIYQSGWKAGSNDDLTIEGCGRNYVVGFFYLNSPQVDSAAGTQVMPTNIPGLGVKVTTQNQAGPYDGVMAIDNDWHDGDGKSTHTLSNSQYQVELVALGGPISSGNLTFSSPLAQVEFRESKSHSNGDVASNVVLTNTAVTVKAMGCNADVSSISFNFGMIKLAAFDAASKVSAPDTQNITLSCEPGTNVSLSVNATAAAGDNANNTVLALTGAGSDGVATGIGVQLGLKASGYDSGANGLPLNQSIPLFTSSRSGVSYNSGGASAQEQLTFSASYYKTAAAVTAGSANATAVLSLTYN
ncbi:type 1 fimbrial protein [Kluyvera genomosp. 1]|uniref:type 1 fimbrial protein n=1 Tax=Kluyvera genomosp. 1 TaxID=2774053 RepID=UPI00092D47F0|nr:type 1 fimbrial protein [Kluyvera genomosp. 1]